MTVSPPESAARPTTGDLEAELAEELHESTQRRHVAGRSSVATWVGLTVLVGASVLLRAEAISIWYWVDEALTVGLASEPALDIPGLLRNDGSPPLYYLLLHGWMRVFGSSEVATHALSLLVATLTVPVGYWCGRLLFGVRAGWMVAILAAASPFLTFFARETRMYALVTLLAMLVATTFVGAFVFGDQRYHVPFIGSMIGVLYTHNWGLYLVAATIVALIPAALGSREPQALRRRALRAYGSVGLAYLPWLSVLLSQIGETGAPWSYTPNAREVVGEVAALVRDERVLVLFVVGLSAGLSGLVQRPRTRLGATAWSLLVMSFVPVGLGWAVAHVEPSWATRYLAVVVGPMLLLVGWALALARGTGVTIVVLAVALWLQPVTRLEGNWRVVDEGKSDARALAARLDARLEPGDVVVVAQPEAVPLFEHYLGDDYRYATMWGEVAQPNIMDWRDSLERLQATSVEQDLLPIVSSLAPGERLVLIGPATRVVRTDTDWIRLFHRRHQQWRRALIGGPGTDLVRRVRPGTDHGAAVPFTAHLFVRTELAGLQAPRLGGGIRPS